MPDVSLKPLEWEEHENILTWKIEMLKACRRHKNSPLRNWSSDWPWVWPCILSVVLSPYGYIPWRCGLPLLCRCLWRGAAVRWWPCSCLPSCNLIRYIALCCVYRSRPFFVNTWSEIKKSFICLLLSFLCYFYNMLCAMIVKERSHLFCNTFFVFLLQHPQSCMRH